LTCTDVIQAKGQHI